MRTLTATLQKAQQGTAAVPYVEVKVQERIAGVRRLRFTRLATGAEADGAHALATSEDGSLIRWRLDGANNVLRQRVTSPDPGSDFGSWTDTTRTATALAASAKGARAIVLVVDQVDGHLYVQESTDNGATWGGWTDVLTPGALPGRVAVAYKNSAGDLALFWNEGAILYRAHRTGGVWGAAAAWTNAVASVTGLAAFYSGDYNLLVAGTASGSGDAAVWSTIYGDGNAYAAGTWGPLDPIAEATAGSGVSFSYPSLAQPDVYRAFWVETYSGAGGYTRAHWSHTTLTAAYVDNRWREPVPFDDGHAYGLALTWSGASVWLAKPSGVWRATLAGAADVLDLTPDVLSIEASVVASPRLPVGGVGRRGGRAIVRLRNDDGRYNAPGAGSLAVLTLGAQITINPGYTTSAGNEVPSGTPDTYWIDRLTHCVDSTGRAELEISAVDGWHWLAPWRARRQYRFAAGAGTLFNLLAFFFARAGIDLAQVGSASSPMSSLSPSFALLPASSGLAAVRRLLEQAPEGLFFRGVTATLKQLPATDASTYAIGGSGGHPLSAGAYGATPAVANRAQAFATGTFGESFNWSEIDLVYDRLVRADEPTITTDAAAANRAAAEVRQAAIHTWRGEITIPPHCGLELYDVVSLTDPRAALGAATRRVIGYTLHYRRGNGGAGRRGDRETGRRGDGETGPVYQQVITLGGV